MLYQSSLVIILITITLSWACESPSSVAPGDQLTYEQNPTLMPENIRNDQTMTIVDQGSRPLLDARGMRNDQATQVRDQAITHDRGMNTLQRCVSPCDCPSGQDCVNQSCTFVDPPVYCCDRREDCPNGQICRTADLVTRQCASCTHRCDCDVREQCDNGQCVASDTLTYCCEHSPCPTGADCVSPQGDRQCVEGCVTACDCWGGQGCVNGACDPNADIRYCCDRALCPQDAACEYDNGANGVCPYQACFTACDCPTGQSCQNGRCILSDVQGLLYCCVDAQCPIGANCQAPDGSLSTCMGKPECETACDCLSGFACQDGFCTQQNEIIVCCDGADCLRGLTCQDSNGNFHVCE